MKDTVPELDGILLNAVTWVSVNPTNFSGFNFSATRFF